MSRFAVLGFCLCVFSRSVSLAAITGIYFADFDEIRHFSVGDSTSVSIISGGRPSAIALDNAGGKLYWTDLLAGVKRSNLDGTGVQTLVSGLGETRGIDLDIGGGKMYWIEQTNAFDKISRANLDGSSREELVSTGIINAFGISVDPALGKMYWTDAGSDAVPNSDRIMRANLDGSGSEVLVNTGLHFPFEIALDVQGGKMYWADGGGGGMSGPATIKSANLDGSNVELLVSGAIIPYGIDLDVAAGKIYWTDMTNRILRTNLDGTNMETMLSSGFDVPLGIAVAGTSQVVPEPSSLAIWFIALGSLWTFRSRQHCRLAPSPRCPPSRPLAASAKRR